MPMTAVAPPSTHPLPMQDPTSLERPQDYGDLVGLMRTLRGLAVREPGQQAIHDALLAKLSRIAQQPRAIRGGWSPLGAATPAT